VGGRRRGAEGRCGQGGSGWGCSRDREGRGRTSVEETGVQGHEAVPAERRQEGLCTNGETGGRQSKDLCHLLPCCMRLSRGLEGCCGRGALEEWVCLEKSREKAMCRSGWATSLRRRWHPARRQDRWGRGQYCGQSGAACQQGLGAPSSNSRAAPATLPPSRWSSLGTATWRDGGSSRSIPLQRVSVVGGQTGGTVEFRSQRQSG